LANYFFGKFGNIPAWLSLQWDSVHVSLKRVKENCFFGSVPYIKPKKIILGWLIIFLVNLGIFQLG